MDVSHARGFLKANHRAVLATFRKDGNVQMSPVTTTEDDDGYAIISSRETAYKVKNLRRDPRAYLCVTTDAFFGEWVQVEGRAEIVSLPDALELLVDYYRRISGEHPDWEEYRSVMVSDRRCLIRIPIERAGPSVSG